MPSEAACPRMELRKIQMTGGASYTVTLPKDWVVGAKLSPGDVVGITQHADGSLMMHPHARARASRARYDIEIAGDDTAATFRMVIAAYLNGYDVIALRSKKHLAEPARRAVRLACRRIVGLQVVEEDGHGIVLQDLADPKEFHVEKVLRRMQAIARAMQEDAVRAFGEPSEDILSSLAERDDEIDSLYWMINKQYHAILRDPAYGARMDVTTNQALNYLMAARLVERVADHALRIAKNVDAMRGDEIGGKLASKIEKHARKAFQLFADAMSAFHKQDATAANAIIGEASRFEATQDTVIRDALSLGGEGILHVAYALDSIGRTAAYAADIAEIAINHRVVMSRGQ